MSDSDSNPSPKRPRLSKDVSKKVTGAADVSKVVPAHKRTTTFETAMFQADIDNLGLVSTIFVTF